MSIIRTALGAALFVAVLFAFRWGANAVIRKAISQSQGTKFTWGSSDLGIKATPAIDWQDPKFKMQPLGQDGLLYRPSEDNSGPKYRIR
jgi:hypothetical protein